MSPRVKFAVVFLSTLLTVMLVIGALAGKGQDKEGAYRPLKVYTDVLARIRAEYVEEPDMDKVTRGALQGLVEYLDPLSSYLTAEQYREFLKSQSNDDGGSGLSTGLIVHKRNSITRALAVLPGSSAAEAGIQPGDFIEAFDGLSTRAMAPAYLHSKLSGEPSTSVTVLVRPARRPDQPKEHVLVRRAVELPPAKHKVLEDGIGYIDLDILDAERVDQAGEAVKALEAQGVKSLILDLRGNSLGEPTEGVRLANYFIDTGAIASLKGQRYPTKSFAADAASTLTELPLVVITNWATSGGAELAAAAILDRDRAEVVGERTYALAALQKTLPLEDGTALVLSIAKYYRPSGAALQVGGVEPSHALPAAELRRYRSFDLDPSTGLPEGSEPGAEGAKREDPFLKKAIELLKQESSPIQKAA